MILTPDICPDERMTFMRVEQILPDSSFGERAGYVVGWNDCREGLLAEVTRLRHVLDYIVSREQHGHANPHGVLIDIGDAARQALEHPYSSRLQLR